MISSGSNQQGPERTPVQYGGELRCGLCVHHKAKMIKSGRDPLWEHFCTKFAPTSSLDLGRYIGKDDLTPDWCPFTATEDK